MRITYFNYLWDIEGISAGSAIKAIEFIRALNALGHQTSLHWRTPQPSQAFGFKEQIRDQLKRRLARFLHGPKSIAMNLKQIYEEQRIIAKEHSNILFSRLELFSLSAAAVARRNRIPFVLEIDCPPVWEYQHFAGRDHWHVPVLPQAIERYCLQTADAMIVISNILRDYLVEIGGDPEKMFVIPNGADPKKFAPLPPDPELQAKYKTNGHVVMGWIGALHGWSGLENLIEMAKQVLLQRQDVMFMFVGGGQNQVMIEQAFADHPGRSRVLTPGRVPHEQTPRFLSLMDIVFAPYPKREFWYPSSMKIFEYMSAGKTVMATDVGQVAEIIQEGVNGVLFDPENFDDMMAKVLHLVDAPEQRRKLAQGARRSVLEHYTWEQHARKMERIFENILARRKDRHPKLVKSDLDASQPNAKAIMSKSDFAV